MRNNFIKNRYICSGVYFVMCCLFSQSWAALPEIPEDSDRAQLWKHKREASIQGFLDRPKSEMIEGLSAMLRQLETLNYRASSERDQIIKRLQVVLLSTHGYADYFVDEIKNARAKSEAESARRVKSGSKPTWSTYNNTRSKAFKTLMYLPSVETARVLGGYLPDEEYLGEKITKNHLPDSFGPPENCRLALMALRHIIASKPFKPKPQYEVAPGELESWQLWYEQVKAGNRTFRLVGDSTKYDFNGPAPKKKLERIARNRTRDKNRLTGKRETALVQFEDSSESIKTDKTSIIGGVIAVGVLMLGAIGYFIRSKSRNTSR